MPGMPGMPAQPAHASVTETRESRIQRSKNEIPTYRLLTWISGVDARPCQLVRCARAR